MARNPKSILQTEASILASERLRISAILESPEGKRNPTLAHELALRSAMDAAAAVAILASAPAQNPYLEAMNEHGPIGLTSAASGASSLDPKQARMAEMLQVVDQMNAANRAARGVR